MTPGILLTFYQTCFWLGIILTGLGFIADGIFDAFGIDFDFDFDTNSVFTATDFGGSELFGFNGSCLLLLLTVTGGIGLLLTNLLSWLVTLLISMTSGLTSYMLMYRYVIYPLKNNNASVLKQSDLRGQIATVKVNIPALGKGCGEVYLEDSTGCRISYIAESDNPNIIKSDSKVRIKSIKNNVLQVALIEDTKESE